MNDSTNFKPRQGYVEQGVATIHHFYISGPIETPDKYIEWFQIMRQAGQMDAIYLHLNSGGGNAFTTVQFMRALNETNARVITSAEGLVASAATMLFLCGDQCEVSDHSAFMFHTFSSASFGKQHEMQAQVLLEKNWGTKLINQVYKNFLTEVEIEKLIDGKDFWMESDEVIKRLNKRKELEEQEKASKPATKRRTRKKKNV